MLALIALFSAVGCSGNTVAVVGDSFEALVAQHKLLVVTFYAPWCALSKKFLPEYELAAQELKGQVTFGLADVSTEEALARYAEGYPTVRVFFNKKVEGSLEYKGELTAEELIKYVKRLAFEEPVLKAVTQQQLDSIVAAAKKTGSPTIAVGAFGHSETSERLAFAHAANKLRGLHYFVEVSPEVAPRTPYLYTLKDDVKTEFAEEFSESHVVQFVTDASFPILGAMKPGAVFESYVERRLPLVWLFIDGSADESSKAIMTTVAGSFKGKLSAVWIDGVKYSPMMEQLGVRKGQFPAVAIEDGPTHYAYTGKFTEPAITSWLQSYLEGKLQPTIRSEPAPTMPVHKGLTTAVGSTVSRLVGGAKNVLLLMYAPWCSHCQALIPTYKEVAKKYAADSSVIVAMIDATANDVPQSYKLDGYPTIVFFQAGSAEAKKFGGDRSLEGLVTFVQRSTGKEAEEEEL